MRMEAEIDGQFEFHGGNRPFFHCCEEAIPEQLMNSDRGGSSEEEGREGPGIHE